MKEIRYTLLTDGSSDQALLPILTWLLYIHCSKYAIQYEWADLRRLPNPPKNLSERIKITLELYPCDLLFVHRDAEGMSLENRAVEIKQAIANTPSPPAVCVVPVRMMEAWLLFDEMAIRAAANNPNGRQPLNLPVIDNIEEIINPKQILYNLLRIASGQTNKRRLKRLPLNKLALRVTEFTFNFEHLRVLRAFRFLEEELVRIIANQNWNC